MKIWTMMLAITMLSGALRAQDVILEQKFDENFKIQGSQAKFASIQVLDDEKSALVIDYPEIDKSVNPLVYIQVKPDMAAGKKIKVSVLVKAENISKPAEYYHGGKFNMLITDQDNKQLWPGTNLGGGSFDWKVRAYTANVPQNVKSIQLMMGLQAATGKIYFRDLKVEVVE